MGDDVIDLSDPSIAMSHTRARVVERVCCDLERAALGAATDPKRLLWSFFAAKEAAYKVVASSVTPPPAFAYRQFVVSPDLRSVTYEDRVFALQIEGDDRYLHAVAWTGRGAWLAGCGLVEAGTSPSDEARRRLCAAVAPWLGCDRESLRIVRPPAPGSWDGFAPPMLLREGRPSGVNVSLTHDGRFAGFAAARP